MSEEPCKKFSEALNIVLFHLMQRTEPKLPTAADAIPNLIRLISAFDDGIFSYGVMGSSSQMMRRVSLNHYEFHLNIAFPFKLTPIKDEIRPGCVLLQADADVQHPAVLKGFLDRKALVEWLFQTISRVFTLKDRNGEFKVTWAPVLEFEHSQWPLASSGLIANGLGLQALPWYAVPLSTRPLDTRSFGVWAPDWERCIMDTHQHSRRLLILFNVLAESYKVDINDLVIRTIMLHEVNNLPRDLGNSMIAFMEAVMARLQEGRQNLFLVESVNVLHFVEDDKLEQNYKYLSKALMELKKLKMEAQNLAQRESNLEYDESDNCNDNDYNNDKESWMKALLEMFNCCTEKKFSQIILGPRL